MYVDFDACAHEIPLCLIHVQVKDNDYCTLTLGEAYVNSCKRAWTFKLSCNMHMDFSLTCIMHKCLPCIVYKHFHDGRLSQLCTLSTYVICVHCACHCLCPCTRETTSHDGPITWTHPNFSPYSKPYMILKVCTGCPN